MAIAYDGMQRIFHLQAKDSSYLFQIVKDGYLAHLHWGKKIRWLNPSTKLAFLARAFSPNPDPKDPNFSFDTLPQEYSGYGRSDFRSPAYHMQLENGTTVTEFKYRSHSIIKGKPKLEGLPATYVEGDEEAETLQVELVDSSVGLRKILTYTVYEDLNVITRSVRFINEGKGPLKLLRASSASVDFDHADFEFLHLSGAWARERMIERRPLSPGLQAIGSSRGASSHQQNPFVALLDKGADEDHGEVYALSLVYSGNFLAEAEVDQYRNTRVSIGIHPFDFSWLLEPGESFQTPEAVLVYSGKGLGEMSRTFHKLYRRRLCRGVYRDQNRPILVNNWEATYFDFDEKKLETIARVGKELGIELFVLDDGWFGKRDDDTSSLGDWFVNRKKLPSGLEGLAGKINRLGMKFGLWLEPEMVSPDSELYRNHPDWCLHVPGYSRTQGRNQLILDFSRKEVGDYVIDVISQLLSSAPITYVKWDMNRHMTEVGSAALPPERQRETVHRYMLGLYRVLETITSAFPHVLFESCSGGGGRFDPGMLYYMPQTWTSDNTDAVSRLFIQYGTSLVYPVVAMGAHVSAVPNHQVHRITPLSMRSNVAMSGNFGYELDLTKLSKEEKELVKEQIRTYKEIRHIIQFGDFYRLRSPFEGNAASWMFVSENGEEFVVFYFQVLSQPNPPVDRIKLKGLNPSLNYRWEETGQVYGADELMYVGLNIPLFQGDFQSRMWRFTRVK